MRSLTEFSKELSEKEEENLFPYDPPHVVRRKDFVDLFDTTPDLAGNDRHGDSPAQREHDLGSLRGR